jgi:hypothetical protein
MLNLLSDMSADLLLVRVLIVGFTMWELIKSNPETWELQHFALSIY